MHSTPNFLLILLLSFFSSFCFATEIENGIFTGQAGSAWKNSSNWQGVTNGFPQLRTQSVLIPSNQTATLRTTTPVFNFQVVVGGNLLLQTPSDLKIIPYQSQEACGSQLSVVGTNLGEPLTVTLSSPADPLFSSTFGYETVTVQNKKTGAVIKLPALEGESSGTWNGVLRTVANSTCQVTAQGELCVSFGDELVFSYLAPCTPRKLLSSSVFLNCGKHDGITGETVNWALLGSTIRKNLNALEDLQNILQDLQPKVAGDFNRFYQKVDFSQVAELIHQLSSACLEDLVCSSSSLLDLLSVP